MYSTGIIIHEGHAFTPDGTVPIRTETTLDCGHSRPPLEPGAFTPPWSLVWTDGGKTRLEYCLDCCAALEREAIRTLPADATYFAYYRIDDSLKRTGAFYNGTITDWHGNELMKIYEWHTYRHNFGGLFIAIHAVDPHGREWHGRASYDHGECINLHRCKEKTE